MLQAGPGQMVVCDQQPCCAATSDLRSALSLSLSLALVRQNGCFKSSNAIERHGNLWACASLSRSLSLSLSLLSLSLSQSVSLSCMSQPQVGAFVMTYSTKRPYSDWNSFRCHCSDAEHVALEFATEIEELLSCPNLIAKSYRFEPAFLSLD